MALQTTPTGLGTLGLPGIYMGQGRNFGLKNHVDIPYVMGLNPKSTLDFGVLDLWALKQRTDSPMLTLAVDNKNIIYSDADFYTYELPVAGDGTTRLISGGNGNAKQGMDGEEIPFVVSRRILGPGSVFKFDLMSRISFLVVDREIEELSSTQFKLWAVLNTNPQVPFVTQGEFQAGRQIVKLADVRGLDFSSFKSVWEISNLGPSKYKNYLSNARLQQSYRVTSGAVEYLNSDTRFTGDELRRREETVMQFFRVKGMADLNVADMTNSGVRQQYMQAFQEQRAKGGMEAAMVNLLDSVAIDMIQEQNNKLMIWSDEMSQIRDGYDTMRLVPGIWFQLDLAGYKHSYSIDSFSLSTITDAIKDFEEGKVPLRESVSNNRYKIKTGRGGAEMIQRAFKEDGFNIEAQIQNAEFGFITGPNAANLQRNLTRFTSYQVEGLGYLEVEWEPGFDPRVADDFVNPILPGGRRLSSYTMLIEDYDLSKDNIVVVRKTGTPLKMRVEAGDETHPLFRTNTSINGQNIQVHQATDELTGYEVKFSGRADTAIVKDPTRLLKLVPKNPRTGLASL